MKSLRKGTEVFLTNEMMQFAADVGAARYNAARARNTHDAKISTDSNMFIDINAACGEIALLALLAQHGLINKSTFDKCIHMLRDMSAKSAASGTDTGDLVLDSGFTLDVKTTDYDQEWSRLIVPYKKLKNKIDGFALVTGNYLTSPRFTFRGFITKEGAKTYKLEMGENALWISQTDIFNLETRSEGFDTSVLNNDVWSLYTIDDLLDDDIDDRLYQTRA